MMVNTKVYGYTTEDGEAFHPKCLEEGSTVTGRLYYLDDEDPFGLSCDGCSEWIFDPTPEHPFVVDHLWSTPNNEVCRECGNSEDAAPHSLGMVG